MDLSFTLDGAKLQFSSVSLDDAPRVIELLRSSLRDPPLFECDGLESLQMISTNELYTRFLGIVKDLSFDPIQEVSKIQTKRLEKAYVYRAELYRRYRVKSTFLRSFEAFVHRFKCTCGREALYQEELPVCGDCVSKEYTPIDQTESTIRCYNHMLHALSEEYNVIREEYHEQKQTKDLMLDLVRRPLLVKEIHEIVHKIMKKTGQNQTKFKLYLTSAQCRMLHKDLDDETLENQEELLLSLRHMLQSLV
jgi:hypothetical protein